MRKEKQVSQRGRFSSVHPFFKDAGEEYLTPASAGTLCIIQTV